MPMPFEDEELQVTEYHICSETPQRSIVFEAFKCKDCKRTPIIFRNDDVDSNDLVRWWAECKTCNKKIYGRTETEAIYNWNNQNDIDGGWYLP